MKKIKKKVLFGSSMCPDCQPAKELLDKEGVRFLYLDITESLINLKKFLKIRDTSPLFDEVKEKEKIGIPCLSINDGEEIILDFSNLDIDILK